MPGQGGSKNAAKPKANTPAAEPSRPDASKSAKGGKQPKTDRSERTNREPARPAEPSRSGKPARTASTPRRDPRERDLAALLDEMASRPSGSGVFQASELYRRIDLGSTDSSVPPATPPASNRPPEVDAARRASLLATSPLSGSGEGKKNGSHSHRRRRRNG